MVKELLTTFAPNGSHVYVFAPLTFKVAVWLGHMVILAALNVGIGVTNTVEVAVDEHPLLIPVTV